MNTQILSALNWRYATKQFNAEKKVSDDDLKLLLESIRLAPSSLGVQPWKVLVITNQSLRQQLKKAAYNQPQVVDASHLIIFASRKTINEEYVDSYVNTVAAVRNQRIEDVQEYKQMIMHSASRKTQEQIMEWTARQAYIALGFLLETAAIMKIDACPMEGFDNKEFDSMLGLDKTDYTSVVIAPVGYRSVEDKYALARKVRFNDEKIFIKI